MNPAAADIEARLRSADDWIPVAEIAREFGIRERELRSDAGRPGLASEFAISSDKGLRHVARATKEECDRFFDRLRSHGIAELVRVRDLRARRADILSPSRPPQTLDAGQYLLPGALPAIL